MKAKAKEDILKQKTQLLSTNNDSSQTTTTTAKEGFCISDKELNIIECKNIYTQLQLHNFYDSV
jgi:hypothetical protein